MLLRGDRHIRRAVNEYRNAGGTMQWIAQTASELADQHGHVRTLAGENTIAIYHHGSRTDRFWHEGRIDDVKELLSTMRECGVQVGLCSHLPRVIEYCEENEWDVDFYMASLYTTTWGQPDVPGEVYDDADREAMCATIRAVDRPCLAFKILAAGRNCGTPDDVREAFQYALGNIKPTDAVVVGMYQEHINQVKMNADIVREVLADG
jgi:hypothetical protein